MSKSIEIRAAEYASHQSYFDGYINRNFVKSIYARAATEQKAIDDEEYRKDMRYVGVKREELIDKVLDTTIQYLNERLIDVVLVGEDKQSGAWGYRILDEMIKDEVKKRLN